MFRMTNRRYWIFQCNPQKYDLLARLEEPDAWITWTIRQHQDEVSRGDVAFIWVSGADAGIAAVMEIDTDPIVMHELPAEQRHWKGETGEDPALRVIGRLVRRGVGLSRDVIRQTPAWKS